MPLRLQIASETPACSSDIPVGPLLNSGKFMRLSQPGKHLNQIDQTDKTDQCNLSLLIERV
jgi:hypothetical protein